MISDPVAAYERFGAHLKKPLAVPCGDFIVFDDGSEFGYCYPTARIATALHPLSELFEYPWFTEPHAKEAKPFVRAMLDQIRVAALQKRDAQRDSQ